MSWSREQKDYIPDGLINQTIAKWQNKQPKREQDCATPSTLMECPRAVWLHKHKVPYINTLGWGKKQRFILGRITENTIAQQLKDEGILLHHWRDYDIGTVPEEGDTIAPRFEHGKGLDKVIGTPDLLLQLPQGVAISDSKTGRSDGYGYVAIDAREARKDFNGLKYFIQVECYYMLLHWNKSWLLQQGLPVPELCHLFSYSLDDGIVRREWFWKPTEENAKEVVRLIRRWNAAYQSATMPDCTCHDYDYMELNKKTGLEYPVMPGVKFCPYGIAKPGQKICSSCCDDALLNKIVEEDKEVKSA